MPMKTNIRKQGNTVVVRLEGKLDFETADVFRDSLTRLERQAGPDQVIFDLADLQFVGSSGISSFIQALREFNVRATQRPRYCNVKSEFRRMITAFDENNSFEFMDGLLGRSLKDLDN
jgi:anti-anti-sigma factor